MSPSSHSFAAYENRFEVSAMYVKVQVLPKLLELVAKSSLTTHFVGINSSTCDK
jgi:hypothetical protein